ncbi:MAG: acetyltransferase [Marinobacter sp.]|uniref:acetyltransferase n=1 Tax=Marinobacter sp. TaxID=50741 RepID=UPI003298E801
MRRLAILGASGHGKVVADTALAQGWSEIVFFDDAWPNVSSNGRWPVLGNTESLLCFAAGYDGIAVGIGNNSVRREKMKLIECKGLKLATIIHPSAVVSDYALIGKGTVVCAKAAVNVDVQIGAGGIINTGAVIEHDCCLGDYVHVSPNAVLSGGVTLGHEVWVGAAASIKQLVSVGNKAVIGMGSVILRDVAPEVTVVGNPVRIL